MNNAILEKLEGRFGEAMNDRGLLAFLEMTKLLDQVTNNEERFEKLERSVEEFLERSGKAYLASPNKRTVTMFDERRRVSDRADALSVLRAREASQSPEVLLFRKDVLNDKLLRQDQVQDWIEDRSKKEGGSHYAEVLLRENEPPVFDKKSERFVLKAKYPLTVISQSTKFLDYGSTDGWVHRMPTKAGSALDRLRWLSERLAVRYRWQKAQATIFVLTDVAPFTPGIQSSIHVGFGSTVLSMDVDFTLTPRQVADFYRRAKKSHAANSQQRTKQLSVKHMRLATFADAKDWKQAMKKWNKQNREWQYESSGLFRRDALKARERLLAVQVRLTPGIARKH